MLPVHDGDRCCLSQEHLVMRGCLKSVSSCQENRLLKKKEKRNLMFDAQTIKELTLTGHWRPKTDAPGPIPPWTRLTSCF